METLFCTKSNHQLQEPVLLSCFHVYCKTCLDTLATGAESPAVYTCLQCGYGTAKDQVKPSHFHQSVLTSQQYTLSCDMCDEDICDKYVNYCKQCDEYYCSACQALHTKFLLMQSHSVVQQGLGSVLRKFRPTEATCTKHSYPLSHACLPCQTLICPLCFHLHEDHDVQDIQNAEQKGKKAISGFTQKLQNLDSNIKADVGVMMKLRAAYNKQMDTKLEEAMNIRDLLITQIEQEFEDFKQRADQQRQQVCQEYDQIMEDYDKQARALQQSRAAMRTIADTAVGGALIQSVWADITPGATELAHSVQEFLGKQGTLPQYEVAYSQAECSISFEGFAGTLDTSVKNIKHTYCPHVSFSINARNPAIDFKHLHQNTRSFQHKQEVSLPQNVQPGNMLMLDTSILIPNTTEGTPEIYQVTIPTMQLAKAELVFNSDSKHSLYKIESINQADILAITNHGLYIFDVKSLALKCCLTQGQFAHGCWVSNGHTVGLEVGTHNLHHIVLNQNSHIHEHRIHNLNELPVFHEDDSVLLRKDRVYIAFSHHNWFYVYNLDDKFVRQLQIDLLPATGQPRLSSTPTLSWEQHFDWSNKSANQALGQSKLCGIDHYGNILFCDTAENKSSKVFMLNQADMAAKETVLPNAAHIWDILLTKENMIWVLQHGPSGNHSVTKYSP